MSFLRILSNLASAIFGAMATAGLLTRLKGKLSSQNVPTNEISNLTAKEQQASEKALKQNISEAITTSLKSEDFLKAIAAHLASELKPCFENLNPSQLDAKLQTFTDKISRQVDTQSTKLTHLTTILDSNSSSTAEKISTIEAAVLKFQKCQEELENCVKRIEDQQIAKLSSIEAGLTQIGDNLSVSVSKFSTEIGTAKSEIVDGATAPISSLTSHLDTILKTVENDSVTLAEIKAGNSNSEVLANIQASNDLHATHVSTLNGLKAAIDEKTEYLVKLQSATADISSAISDNKTQIININSAIDEIKTNNICNDILAETKVSRASLASSALILDEIKVGQSDVLTAISDSKKMNSTSLEALSGIKQAESDVLEILKTTNQNVELQGAALKDINTVIADVAKNSGIISLEESTGKIREGLNSLGNSLEVIDKNVKNLPPAAEKVDLGPLTTTVEEIKNIVATPPVTEKVDLGPLTTTVEEIKNIVATPPAAEKVDLGPLTTTVEEIKNIVATPPVTEKVDLGPLTTTVEEIKNIVATPPVTEKVDLGPLITTVDEIKSIVATPPVIEKLDLSPLTTTVNEIKNVVTTPPVIEKVDLSSLENSIQTLHSSIKDIKSANETLSGKINLSPLISTLEEHSTCLSEIKSKVLAPPVIEKIDISSLEASVNGVVSSISSQNSQLNELKTSISAQESSEKISVSSLEKSIQSIVATLDSQNEALSNIKTATPGLEILAEVKAIQSMIGPDKSS